MQTNSPGRHRKPSATRAIATRTAVTVGAAAAAVLVSGGGASAATAAPSDAPPGVLPISCTGYPIDAFTTCGLSGHYGKGSDRGDASGGDTPVLGGGAPPSGLVY